MNLNIATINYQESIFPDSVQLGRVDGEINARIRGEISSTAENPDEGDLVIATTQIAKNDHQD